MNKQQAFEKLSAAPSHADIASHLNSGITQAQSVQIIRRAVDARPENEEIPKWLEQRVHQVSHPVYSSK